MSWNVQIVERDDWYYLTVAEVPHLAADGPDANALVQELLGRAVELMIADGPGSATLATGICFAFVCESRPSELHLPETLAALGSPRST